MLSLVACLYAALICSSTLGDNPARTLPGSIVDAAEIGDVKLVKQLLEKGANPHQTQADGMTALHWAVHRGDPELTKALIQAKADVNSTNRYGVTPLALVCSHGDERIASLLLEAGANPNSTQAGGETALMTASRTGRIGVVRALLDRGASVNAKEYHGQTALMWAAAEGHADVVEALIKAGAKIDETLNSGYNPLFFAVREGKIGAVRALIKAGASVNQSMLPTKPAGGKAPAKGTTPLVLAVENGHFDLAAILLELGADPNDQATGFTPLHMLTWVRKPNRGDGDDGDPPPIGSGEMTSLHLVDKLVEHGADVNAQLKRGPAGRGVLKRVGATPFLLAAMTADVPLMRKLVALGADPRLPNADGATPLMAAAGLGCLAPAEEAGTEPEALEAVSYTMALGNDINAVDSNGETAMHGAAYKNFPKMVDFLAANGAKIEVWNHKNKYGWTPLAIAEGFRPGNFKPSVETIDALERVMKAAGVPPSGTSSPKQSKERYQP